MAGSPDPAICFDQRSSAAVGDDSWFSSVTDQRTITPASIARKLRSGDQAMPTVSLHEATEKLAQAVEKARPSILPEIYAELFPRKPRVASPVVKELAEHIRHG